MPGQHDTTKQKFVGLWIDGDIASKIEAQRGRLPISQFVRDAIVDHLASLGIVVPRDKALAPDRAGKGGRPRKYPAHRPDNLQFNESSSGTAPVAKSLGATAVKNLYAASPKRARKSKAGGSSGGT